MDSVCEGQPDLRSKIDKLLAADARRGILEEELIHPDIIEAKLLPGDILQQRFRILRFIGRGGMGDVYEAEDQALPNQPHVALKVIRPDIAADPQILGRFLMEWRRGPLT